MTPRPALASGAPSLLSAAAMGAGLWALGAVQPLLDLLGRNPAFFVAADVITLETVRMGAWFLPLIPVGVWLGVWLNRRFSQVWFHRVILAGLFLAGLQLIFNFKF